MEKAIAIVKEMAEQAESERDYYTKHVGPHQYLDNKALVLRFTMYRLEGEHEKEQEGKKDSPLLNELSSVVRSWNGGTLDARTALCVISEKLSAIGYRTGCDRKRG